MNQIELAAAAVDAVLGLLLYRFLQSKLEGIGATQWRRDFSRIERERQRRVRRAISRGHAVDDPRDARLALEMIERSRAITDVFAAWPVLWLELPGAAVSVAAFVATRGLLSGFLATLSVLALIAWLFARLSRKRHARRLETASAANAALARVVGHELSPRRG
jgi:hypothetical protein